MKYLFVFSQLFLSIASYSQEVFPLANAQWTGELTLGEYPNATKTFYRYVLQGDTMIDAIKRSKVYFISNINKKDSSLVGYFYVKNKIVYYRQDVNDQPDSRSAHLYICDTYFDKDYPLYDFSLEKGDTFNNDCMWYPNVVSSVDTLIIENVKRKRIYFNSVFWLEGMGSDLGLFDHIEQIPTSSEYAKQFVCFCHNDTVLYLNSDFSECPQADFNSIDKIEQNTVNILFNPIERMISITSPYLINHVKIFNSNGDLLGEEQTNGKFQTTLHTEHLPKTGVCVAQIIFQDGRRISKKLISK
jgi:hypothetical protein